MDLTRWPTSQADSVAQLAVEHIARAVLKALPGGASADDLLFGLRDKLRDEALAQTVERLRRQIRELASRFDRLDGAEINALFNTPAARELRETLAGLSADRFSACRQDLLDYLSHLQSDNQASPADIKRALEAILDQERRMREQIATLRGFSRIWLEDFHDHLEVTRFLNAARAVHHELLQGLEGRRRHFVDTSVLYHAVLEYFSDDSGFASHFLSNTSGNYLAIHPEKIIEVINMIDHMEQKSGIIPETGDRNLGRMSKLLERMQHWEKPNTWLGGEPPFAQVKEAIHYLKNISVRLPSPGRLESDAATLVSTIQAASSSSQEDSLVLVTSNSRLLSAGTRLGGERHPVRLVYGAAWRGYYQEVRNQTGDRLAATTSRLGMLDFRALRTREALRQLAPEIEAFIEAVQPFHEAVADHLQAELDDRIGDFMLWLDALDTGADRFDRLRRALEMTVSSDLDG